MSGEARIADGLVVTFTAGVGLADWALAGVLGREWALYAHVGRQFRRVVLVMWGDSEANQSVGASLRFEPGAGAQPELSIVTIAGEADEQEAANVSIERIAEALAGCRSAIVKTNQMQGGHVAVAIAEALEGRGITAALVARGGYPWSRFAAWEHGPASPQAAGAAAREGELCRAADVVIGTTRDMVDDLAWRHELPPDRFAIVPNYISSAIEPGAGAGVDASAPMTVLFAGRLEKQKRVDRLIESLARLPGDLKGKVQLEIVGDGSQREWLRQLATSAGVRAVFEPRISHEKLLEKMSRCAVYAQTSDYEGHPKTVVEAMAMGAPVLVSDSPGLGSIIDDGITGLCTRADPEAIARGLSRLLSDRALAQELGRAAAMHIREHLAIERVAVLEQAVYRNAIGRAEAARAHGRQRESVEAVRFEPSLINAGVDQAVGAWMRPLRGFARRLPARKRAEFVMALDTPLYHLQGETAVEADGGLHPKHRLMRYHDFFVERIWRGQRVIDLGCGVGALAASIAEHSEARVVGIDCSEPTLDRARARAAERRLGERLTYLQGDITELRAPGRFDVVVLSNVLEHITERPERLRMWREWYGGEAELRFLIRVPAFDREWRVPWKKELGVEWRLDPTHETEYTQAQLEHELRQAGLRVRECIARWGEYYIAATGA